MTKEQLEIIAYLTRDADGCDKELLRSYIKELMSEVADLKTENAALRNFANPVQTTDAEERFFEH